MTSIQDEHARLLDASHVKVKPNASLGSLSEERPRVTLTWKDLSYETTLPKTKEVKRILKGVSGYAGAGQMIAILGPSGAGKTTMLDILAQRHKGGTVHGELLMNGHPITQGVFRRVSAYVQQEDIMHGYLTVRETITYSAMLRLPSHVSQSEINDRVTTVMQLLGIDHVADRKIGSEIVRGVSGGEKKRTAIAVELVTNPSLIFLDEPTTGLDTFTALHLLYILKNLTRSGTTVVFSIHQPRSSIFRLFDTVLLLNGYGEEAYFGPADRAVDFLVSVGVPQKHPDNPADFLLDSVSVVRAAEELNKDDFPFMPPPTQSQDIAAAFRSTKLAGINAEVDAVTRIYAPDSKLPPAMTSPYYRNIFQQIRVVSVRAFVNKLRDPIATVVAIIVAIFFATLVGSIYFKLGKDQAGITDRLGVLFFLTMNTAFSNLGSLAIFLFDRSIYVREHRNGMYSPLAYYLGKIIQDVPLSIAVNLVFDVIAYYMVGLQPQAYKFGWFFLIATLVMLNSYAMCMWMSNMSKNYQVANVIAPLVLVLYLLPSGFLINLNSIPIIWRWIKYISFFRYGFEALVLNEFEGLMFDCSAATQAMAGGGSGLAPPSMQAEFMSFVLANVTTLAPAPTIGPTPAHTTSPVTLAPLSPGSSGNHSHNGSVPCLIDGLTYVESTLGFARNDFSLDVAVVAGSIGVYLLFGYMSLRFLRSNEGK